MNIKKDVKSDFPGHLVGTATPYVKKYALFQKVQKRAPKRTENANFSIIMSKMNYPWSIMSENLF